MSIRSPQLWKGQRLEAEWDVRSAGAKSRSKESRQPERKAIVFA